MEMDKYFEICTTQESGLNYRTETRYICIFINKNMSSLCAMLKYQTEGYNRDKIQFRDAHRHIYNYL